MTVERFIDGYKIAKNKEGYIKQHIVTEYVPYEEKIAICKIVVEKSYLKDGLYNRNSVIKNAIYTLMKYEKYTDIEFNFDEILNNYNLLCESNADLEICKHINREDNLRFDQVMEMVESDFVDNNRSIISYIDSQLMSVLGLINQINNETGDLNE